jgi:hypothetical protein
MHDVLSSDDTPDEEDTVDFEESPPAKDPLDTRLINDAKSSVKHIPLGDIRRVMSKSSTRQDNIDQLEY